jgi:hypothetical protein
VPALHAAGGAGTAQICVDAARSLVLCPPHPPCSLLMQSFLKDQHTAPQGPASPCVSVSGCICVFTSVELCWAPTRPVQPPPPPSVPAVLQCKSPRTPLHHSRQNTQWCPQPSLAVRLPPVELVLGLRHWVLYKPCNTGEPINQAPSVRAHMVRQIVWFPIYIQIWLCFV